MQSCGSEFTHVCSLCDRARLSCLHSWGSSVSLPPFLLPSCLPSSLLALPSSPLCSRTQHTLAHCLLRARTVQVLMLCPHCSLLTLSPAQLSDMLSVTPSPLLLWSAGQALPRPEHQASAGRVPPVIGDPASKPWPC